MRKVPNQQPCMDQKSQFKSSHMSLLLWTERKRLRGSQIYTRFWYNLYFTPHLSNLWVGPGFKFLFLPKIKIKSRYCVVTDSIYQASKISPKSGLVRSREHPPLTTRFSYLSFLFIFLFHDYSLLRS